MPRNQLDLCNSDQYLRSSAVFDDSRAYRWLLTRQFHPPAGKKAIAFIGLNPSTADDVRDDNTVRGCAKRARLWGYGLYYMLNIFALRGTNPKCLYGADDPIGRYNDTYILKTVGDHSVEKVVCAWGNHGKLLNRGAAVLAMLEPWRDKLFCIGMTNMGEPRHPLYTRLAVDPTPLPRASTL